MHPLSNPRLTILFASSAIDSSLRAANFTEDIARLSDKETDASSETFRREANPFPFLTSSQANMAQTTAMNTIATSTSLQDNGASGKALNVNSNVRPATK